MKPEEYRRKLEKRRKNIDEIDREIAQLLIRRMDEAERIGELKKEFGADIEDCDREKQVLENAVRRAEIYGGAPIKRKRKDTVVSVFEKIMEKSRAVQSVGKVSEKPVKTKGGRRILIINGPNMNMLGIREPGIYGGESYDDLVKKIRNAGENIGVDTEFFQSNSEGAIVDRIQQAFGNMDGIIINPAAYTHTSIAIADALRAVSIPTVEVHISDISTRENYRKISYTSEACIEVVKGLGTDGYIRALEILCGDNEKKKTKVAENPEKKKIRDEVKELRTSMTEEYRKETSEKIFRKTVSLPEFLVADTIFCFAGTEKEPDTMMIMDHAMIMGKRVCVPLCTGMGSMKAVEIMSIDDLKEGSYGILEPEEGMPEVNQDEVDFAIIPCMAASEDGNRLGHGGGYYDRWLEKFKGKKAVLCTEAFLYDDIPVDEKDVKMDIVITENQVIK